MKIVSRVGLLVVGVAFSACSSTPNEEVATDEAPLIKNIQSMTRRGDDLYDITCIDGRVERGVSGSYIRNEYVCLATDEIGGRRCETYHECTDGFQCEGLRLQRTYCLPNQLPEGAPCASPLQCLSYRCAGADNYWHLGTCEGRGSSSGGSSSGGSSSGGSSSGGSSSGGSSSGNAGRSWSCTFTPQFHESGILLNVATNEEAHAVTRNQCVNAGLSNCSPSCRFGSFNGVNWKCEYWADGPQRSVSVTAFTVQEASSQASQACRSDNSGCSNIVCN